MNVGGVEWMERICIQEAQERERKRECAINTENWMMLPTFP